jgi:hypothetical protein
VSLDAQRLELLAWIARQPRSYPETIEVWSTRCPQHALWDDAVADGLVRVVRTGARSNVELTAAGEAALRGG